MTIRKMEKKDFPQVLSLAENFYRSTAVSHPVAQSILISTFNSAVDEHINLTGYVLCEEVNIVGFAYITTFFACEVGGICVMIEELFLEECCRGKGYGSEFFGFVFKEYQGAKRFRLEVTKQNDGAIKLYEKLGFNYIQYDQMILDL